MASNRFTAKRPLNKGPSICFPPPPPPPPELTPVVCLGSPIPSTVKCSVNWAGLDNPPPFPPPGFAGFREFSLSHIGEVDGHQTWRGLFSSGRILRFLAQLSCGCGPTPSGWHLSTWYRVISKTRDPDIIDTTTCVAFLSQESPAPGLLRIRFPPISDGADASSVDFDPIWCYTPGFPPP